MKRSGAEYYRVRLQLYYLLVAETTRQKVEMIIDIKASDTAHSSFFYIINKASVEGLRIMLAIIN
jgi:hypothetical protein